MGLSVYLYSDEYEKKCTCYECNNIHTAIDRDTLFESHITHNLNTMADKAGIYKHLWRPKELGITNAHQLIKPLEDGLRLLKSKRVFFMKFNPENGFGSYDGLVRFVRNYLDACKEYPDSTVEVCA